MRRISGAARAAARAGFAAAAVFVLGACDGRQDDGASGSATLAVAGDSTIQMRRDTLVNGAVSTQCEFDVQAEVAGPEGEQVVLRGGRVEYVWLQTGRPATSYDWSPESLHRFWGDTILPTGHARVSNTHGFSQSEPAQPVRGTVTFRYSAGGAGTEQETEPFRFYCY